MKESLKSLIDSIEYPIQKNRRIFPSIFIAGFQKCGTTSLYHYLSQLPSIEPGLEKEKNDLSQEVLNLNKYIKNFPLKEKGKITLCGSHQLTYFPKGLARLKELVPDCKIILIMRNPVERAFSRYQNNLRSQMGDKESFRDSLEVELEIISTIKNIEDPEEVFEKTKWRGHPAGAWDMTYRMSAGMYMTRGIYYNQIKKIKDLGLNFHPMFLENLTADFHGEMASLINYLEIDPKELESINPEKKNTGGYKKHMDSKTRKLLEDFFKPHNEKLFNLLGVENPWDKKN